LQRKCKLPGAILGWADPPRTINTHLLHQHRVLSVCFTRLLGSVSHVLWPRGSRPLLASRSPQAWPATYKAKWFLQIQPVRWIRYRAGLISETTHSASSSPLFHTYFPLVGSLVNSVLPTSQCRAQWLPGQLPESHLKDCFPLVSAHNVFIKVTASGTFCWARQDLRSSPLPALVGFSSQTICSFCCHVLIICTNSSSLFLFCFLYRSHFPSSLNIFRTVTSLLTKKKCYKTYFFLNVGARCRINEWGLGINARVPRAGS
jgi:hypothetical protein